MATYGDRCTLRGGGRDPTAASALRRFARQPDDELGSLPRPAARGLDRAVVAFDQPAHDGEADAHPALVRRHLREQIEDVRQHVGRDRRLLVPPAGVGLARLRLREGAVDSVPQAMLDARAAIVDGDAVPDVIEADALLAGG